MYFCMLAMGAEIFYDTVFVTCLVIKIMSFLLHNLYLLLISVKILLLPIFIMDSLVS
ncbi:hypothetical protein ECH_0191 [Ehrlichia chaffeensis str. Arkansas]|uniref:Uncharacterized protein n=1 Tax=Ehrlichia chaffeensis (strain ATCC CRL-10679 / Arkansas) TaxID=205920 RepID=Q2GHR8_EHRCR|nr:hypothetical protein ECH_0191 [Ehrlichia chaffeensis str. Arkansas]